uniref:Uncharacterized protein n=1 Tax=Anguilla anguilla TaxID=7936 RepID=A0A0E9QNN3_ANGAN
MLFLMATQQQLDLQTTCKHGSIATKRNNKIFLKKLTKHTRTHKHIHT